MTTNNAWNSPDFSAYQANNCSGVDSWSGSGSYYSISGTDFTLLRGGKGYIKSYPIYWSGPQTITGLSAGSTHYIYIDISGTIQSTTTRDNVLYENNIVLFEVLVDSAVTPNVIVVREDHPVSVQSDTSEWGHTAFGSIIADINNGANIVVYSTTGIQINGSDILLDHGLYTSIPDSGGIAVSWRRFYTNASGKWVQYNNQAAFTGVYNNAGTITSLTSGKYGIFRLYVSKDDLNTATPRYFAVIDTSEYDTLPLARNAITSGVAAATNELYNLELAQLGYVIFRSNVITEVLISKSTGRSISTVGQSTTPATLISTSTIGFNRILTSSDKNVQNALVTLDAGCMAVLVGATSQDAKPNYIYVPTSSSLITITIPSTISAGTRIAIVGSGSGGWKLGQRSGQTIRCGTPLGNTTTGTSGYVASNSDKNACIEVMCTIADTEFVLRNFNGSLTIA